MFFLFVMEFLEVICRF